MTVTNTRSVNDERFPKAARLLRPSEFRRVQLSSRTVDLGPLVVRVAKQETAPSSDGQAFARLGLAVSRRAGNAVARNHIKRRVREWFRKNRSLLVGYDLVVSARSEAAALHGDDIDALLSRFLERFGRI